MHDYAARVFEEQQKKALAGQEDKITEKMDLTSIDNKNDSDKESV